MHGLVRQFRDFFVSLQLTVVLLIMSLLLVFLATLHQVNLGIWAVQEKYFRSFVVVVGIGEEVSLTGYTIAIVVIGLLLAGIRLLFFYLPAVREILTVFSLSAFGLFYGVPIAICALLGKPVPAPVLPGGYVVGGFLLANLLSAHIYRFSLTWKKLGIQLAHAGLIILLLGELVTGLLQQDSSMRMQIGETKRYAESFRDHELALLDRTDPQFDEVVAVPEDLLADEKTIQHPKLPFQVRVHAFIPNATMEMGDPAARPGLPVATQGLGPRVQVIPLPLTYKPDEINVPAAFVEIITTEGSLGTWAVSPIIGLPQTFNYQGRTWELNLRLRRHYQPFSLNLLDVTHEVYPGTEIPKNFASRVRLRDDAGGEDREVVIYMNNPLRHGGLTFYQYQMNAPGRLSVFQVVRNPGWLLPYIACILMGLGLTWQFLHSLSAFVRKRSATQAA